MKTINVGVIPAAGRGMRINDLPLTRLLPKTMLPILNKPIMEYNILKMVNMGIKTIYIVVSHKKEVIIEYFGNGKDFGVDIEYIKRHEPPQGIACSIGLTEEFIHEPFVVILGDDFTVAESLNNLVKTFWDKKAIVVEGVVIENNEYLITQTNCIILKNDNKIHKIIEKPKTVKSNLRGCGIYICDPSIYEYIKKTPISFVRNEKEITDTIGLIAAEERAYGEFIDGFNTNVNTVSDLLLATQLILKDKNYKDVNL